MGNVTGGSLAPILSRIAETPTYNPMDADTFGDWSLEAGDVVTVTRDGREYKSTVHQTTTTWKKQQNVAISSSGNEKRDSISNVSQRKYSTGSSSTSLRNDRYLHMYVEDEYQQLRSGLELTASSAHLYSWNLYKEMGTGLMLTASSAILYAKNKYSEMETGLKLTASSALLYASNKYAEMSTGLRLTASSTILYATNKYNEMTSGLRLTSSSAILFASNKYTEMSTGLRLTASSAVLYATSKYSEMRTGLQLTASSAVLYATSKYSEMQTGLQLTASSAVLYATSKYNDAEGKITVQAGRITQIVSAVGSDGEVTAGSIVLAINNAGESEAHIDANKVYIGNSKSTTVINGKLNASDVTAAYIQSKIAQIANVSVQNLSSERGGVDVNSVSTNSFYQGDVSCYVPHAITSLQIVQNGNTYTLQRKWFSEDTWTDVGSFSRATTLSGAWSGNKYTVTASPQGNTISDTIAMLTQGNGSTSFSVSACHTSAVAANEVARENIYLTEDTSAKKVYARAGSSAGTAYGGISTQATYTAGYDVGYDVGYDDGYEDGGGGGTSIGDVSIESIAVSTYQPSGYEGAVLLTELPNAIKNNHRTYVWFKVRVRDTDNQQIYSKYYYCASAD